MKCYLVGGAVRDELLGRKVHDLDYVITGTCVAHMLEAGYQQVGADFPVFLHPQTKHEYALARTERKSGVGYKGFNVDFDASVTLEQDLQRRDLTINAIAKSEQGQFIDPYGGRNDLQARILRHVSGAFVEDPLRVLRVARFAAQLSSLGFTIHPDTLALMTQLAQSGELTQLTPERVFNETQKALASDNPEVYFNVLKSCGALAVLFAEIDALCGVPQNAYYHPEVDCYVHTMMVLQQASLLTQLPQVRWAALLHDLGKAITPEDVLPGHKGHEFKGVELVKVLNLRLKAPNIYTDIALKVTEHHLKMHHILDTPADAVLELLEILDTFRKPELLNQFVVACEADARGRLGFEQRQYPAADFIRQAHLLCQSIVAKPFVEQGHKGIKIKTLMRQARIEAITELKSRQPNQ